MLSGNLHGGSVVASYPFDDSATHEQQGHYSPTEDDSLFRYLALVYARHHPVMRLGRPNCSDTADETFKDGITNGADWYDVPGKRESGKSRLARSGNVVLLHLGMFEGCCERRSGQQFLVRSISSWNLRI